MFRYAEADELVEMHAPEELSAGSKLTITLEYSGIFKDNLEGFYCAEYDTGDGTRYQLAVTSMEPTCARQVRRGTSAYST